MLSPAALKTGEFSFGAFGENTIGAHTGRAQGCDWFGRQELPRLVLGSLRGAEQPLSCVEIALIVMERNGLPADAVALRRVAGIVKGAPHRRQGRRNKVARGGFSAVFFVQCLRAVGCKSLTLE
jgi:hypothetical protein